MPWTHRTRPTRRDVTRVLLRWYLAGSAVLTTVALVAGLVLAPAAGLGMMVLVLLLGGAWRLLAGMPERRRTAAVAVAGVSEIEAWLHRRGPRDGR